MNYKNAAISIIYSLGQISLGLLLHPYQTLQSVVQERVFIWMTLLPTAVLAIITVLWKFVIVPIVRVVFSCQKTPIFACQMMPFLSDWITFFCLYWQILVLYLFFRFSEVFKTEGAKTVKR